MAKIEAEGIEIALGVFQPTISIIETLMRKIFIGLIRIYQLMISPIIGPSCRFYPSCSQYAIEAIKIHGIFKGSFLAVHRVLRCHPGCEGGLDPVPDKNVSESKSSQKYSKESETL